jgi:hypothetical protein
MVCRLVDGLGAVLYTRPPGTDVQCGVARLARAPIEISVVQLVRMAEPTSQRAPADADAACHLIPIPPARRNFNFYSKPLIH